MHDLVIGCGTIVDGTGAPSFIGDLAISKGRIIEIGGKARPGKREIDAWGQVVCPGFIDTHTHMMARSPGILTSHPRPGMV
jgi:N-acyl-D-amino-acid deacylase